MKARILIIALAALATSTFAQTGAVKPVPATTPATTLAAASAPTGAPSMAALPSLPSAGPRNPMKPPAITPPSPLSVPPTPGAATPGLPPPVIGKGALPGMPAGTMDPDTDPVKANGRRIGALNGKAIFKLEEAYFFDTESEKTKK